MYSFMKGKIAMGRKPKYRKWTPDEERKLIRLSETKTQSEIAKSLKRSIASVKCKRIEMGIDCFTDQTDLLNITQISEITGIQKGSIGKTWRKYGLVFQKKGYFCVVSEDELIEFMQKNPKLWKASDCDYYFFCRFPWFLERLDREKAGEESINHYRNRKVWTELDISRFKMLKTRGLTHGEIAEELGRTRQSIDHMNMRLCRN